MASKTEQRRSCLPSLKEGLLMKGKIPSFLSGVIVTFLLVALPVTALAFSGAIKI